MCRLHRTVVVICMVMLGPPAGALAGQARVEGTLVEKHGHRPDGTSTASSYAVRSGGRLRPLAGAQPEALIGQRVRVDDGEASPGLQGRARAADDQRLAAAVAPGPRSLLVILLTTSDKPVAAATPDATRAAIFTGEASASALYEQQSDGATRLVGRVRSDGDVTAPLAVGVATTGCDARTLADAADTAARADGWALDAYDHVLYVLPRTTACSWGGLGQLPGSRLWSNGVIGTAVIAHEVGHNLGAHHANSLRCVDGAGGWAMVSQSCATTEYGDPFDVMGLPARLMSSWHRAQLGQLPASQQLTARESQTMTLISSDDALSAGPRLLLVPRKAPRTIVSSWLALELRSERGPFDLWAPGAPVTTGLSIRVVPRMDIATQSQLLDARPLSSTFSDAPLQVGETLSDTAHGVTIRLNSISATAANVTLTMPVIVDDVPPSAPVSIWFGGDTRSIALHWTPAVDDEAMSHYEVERDGTVLGTTTGLNFFDTRVAELTRTTYRVRAVDVSGNRSTPVSRDVLLTDATPPGAVPGLTLAADGAGVALSWAAAADNRAVAGYRVTRGGSAVTQVAGLGYRDRPPSGEQVYEVRAVDTAGNEGPAARAAITVAAPVVTTPPAGAGAVVAPPPAPARAVAKRPQIVRLRRSRKGSYVTMSFSAAGAKSIAAYRGGRRAAKASGSRLTVRLRLRRELRKQTVKIVASSAAGSTSRRFALR